MSTFIAVLSFLGRFKYVITVAVLALVVCFAGEDSLLANHQRQKEIEQMRVDLAERRRELSADSAALSRLENDPNEAEHIAREMYLMRRAGEDVYLFVSENLDADSIQ